MEIYFKEKNKNKELIINSHNNKNDIYKLIIENKGQNIEIILIKLKEKINEQNKNYYINESSIYYKGLFQYDDIKPLLIKLNKKNFNHELNIKKNNSSIELENIILKEEKNNIYKENPINEEYNKIPIFKCKQNLYTLKELKLNNHDPKIYEIFYFNKYFNEPCLILLQNQLTQIGIIRIKDNTTLLTIDLTKLIKQKKQIYDIFNQTPPILKHYLIGGKDYLIYAFKNDLLIYDLNMNKIKYKIKLTKKFYIEKLLLIKSNNINYFILNQINSFLEMNALLLGEKNKVFCFDKGNFIQDINHTQNDICYNVIYWKNDFIIKCCLNYIKIINFKTSILYHQFVNNHKNLNGYFSNKNNNLIIFSKNVFNAVDFYNLDEKVLLNHIELRNNVLNNSLNIFKWNGDIICINCEKRLFFIDIQNMQIMCIISNDNINFVRKINIKEYGKCLLNLK